jgi:disulfide bond formation protein DsbB
MSKRRRRVIAIVIGLIGLAMLVYYYYAMMVLRAYVGMFEALHVGPVQQSQTIMSYAFPFVGWLALAASVALFVGPELKRRFRSSGRKI